MGWFLTPSYTALRTTKAPEVGCETMERQQQAQPLQLEEKAAFRLVTSGEYLAERGI